MSELPLQRVSPIRGPDAYTLPSRPDNASTVALDAFRQTQFLLGSDLALFAEGMNLQLALIQDAYPSQYRTYPLAAIVSLWSRAYVCLEDAMLLTTRGSYVGAIPLVRAACEFIAAEEGLRAGEHTLYNDWLKTTLRPDESYKAFEFELGRYHSGEVLAADDTLRAVYRASVELARPHFGASLLQVAPESNNTRLAIAFADASFHVGWAEIILGWLLALAARQVRIVTDAAGIFPVSDERRLACDELQTRVAKMLASLDRARIEEVDDAGGQRLIVHNFRRSASGAPKKYLL